MNSLYLFNSLTNKKELFSVKNNNVTWYACGPTVYNDAHLGHAYTYISTDIIRRVLQNHFKYNITFHMNITDIDDKIINKAKECGVSFYEHARKYEKLFMTDLKKLSVLEPDIITRVTDHIPQLIDYIKVIINNGFAYVSNGSVYMNMKIYKNTYSYTMCPCNEDMLQQEDSSADKIDSTDFVLWKKSEEPNWDSPWSKGRPGWHLECSVIASTVFGSNITIHSGGIDLKFPHHANELVQSTAYFRADNWISYFIHTAHLEINGMKMSKSLKNFITIDDFLKKYTSRQLRLLFVTKSWNKSFIYSDDCMTEIIEKDRRIANFINNINKLDILSKSFMRNIEYEVFIDKQFYDINMCLSDNINTSGVIDIIMNLISVYYTTINIPVSTSKRLVRKISEILDLFGLNYTAQYDGNFENIVDILAVFRKDVRISIINKENPLKFCDDLRETMRSIGISLEDKSDILWKKLV